MNPVQESIHRLVAARRGPEAASSAGLTLPDAQAAYAVQDGVARELGGFADGPARFWKSGGPSHSALTHAPLPPAGVWTSPADARDWPFRLRGIEVEIALRLSRDVDAESAASLDGEAARQLVDAMCVSIEIVDSRWAEALEAPALAKLADFQSHGALVLGEWTPYAPRDWTAQSCRATVGARAPVERTGTHSLVDPVFVLPAWLRHATRHGATLTAGTAVTTGTWVGVLPANAGDVVTAEFLGIGSASVRL
ncbi:MAG: fumarylacetoacetate hydrolase family protein [Gammaproteobacteria bacterium]|nr:fumarylacetoacetate hydrolase family protein [Gammaproteobacteria bacterium]MBU1440858.1 fumarylacetoacetate hydrolase family protein [Gammaproteobacteria bacterium]MBU2284885.1 fumarylacetoacetate hydrolase family protein [Gammaproteobacteria bacterium]MBU2410040.1 fumarylacetoacetate hydrolase family protein [Gammaproteobacteria bacterium]